MTEARRPPPLADVPKDVSPDLAELLGQMIATHDIREGRTAKGTNSRFVTIQDLVNAGVVADGVIK